MSRRFLCLLFIISLWSPLLLGQVKKKIAIEFHPTFKGIPLELTKGPFDPETDSTTIEVFKCYISNLKFYLDNQLVFSELDSYHLLNAEEPNSLSLILESSENFHFNHLSFSVGIDSLTNAQGPQEGDLDPVHGMYWTWQSGYINFKLEGQSFLSSARNQAYQYHLGGFLNKHEAAITVDFPINNPQKIAINIDLDRFLDSLEISKKAQVMSPGFAAVKLSKLFANQFSIR